MKITPGSEGEGSIAAGCVDVFVTAVLVVEFDERERVELADFG
jgi:hypothetical protein